MAHSKAYKRGYSLGKSLAKLTVTAGKAKHSKTAQRSFNRQARSTGRQVQRVSHSVYKRPQRVGKAVTHAGRKEAKHQQRLKKQKALDKRHQTWMFLHALSPSKRDDSGIANALWNTAPEHLHQNPSAIARSNVEDILQETWPHLGLHGKAPKVVFNSKTGWKQGKGQKVRNAVAYANLGGHRITLEPGTAERLQAQGQYGGDWTPMASLVAHESAHTRQHPTSRTKGQKPEWLIEGGADDFAKLKAQRSVHKIGARGKRFRGTKEYSGYRRKAGKLGKSYLLHGQFK